MGAILGRCVPAPTRDPTSRAVPEHWGCDHNSLVLSGEMGAILGRCVPAPTGDLSSCNNLNTGPTKTCTRDQAVRATEGKVADHVQEDTSTHLDGEIKEEGANDVETVVKDQVIVSTKIVWMKGLVMVWMKGLVMVWMKGLSDGVDEGPSGGVNDSVNEGPCDGVDERPSDEGPSDGPSDGEEKILLYLYLTGSTKILKYI
ncbi:hypothetical protein EMCRGX_G018966 [Ephydatia muelleri]